MLGWECLFYHEQYKVILSVFVDDFKMAGRHSELAKAWKANRGPGKLELDEPTDFGPHLGCDQHRSTITQKEAKERLENTYPLVSRTDAEGEHLGDSPDASEKAEDSKTVKLIRCDMEGSFRQRNGKRKELAEKNGMSNFQYKKVAFPSIDDHQLSPEEFETEGLLSKDAATIVMKCLYGARFVRFDLLWPIRNLARKASKWTKACDRRLYRLMCYLNSTLDHSLEAFIGDAPEDCHVLEYVDASFADDINDSKSTSGMFIAIVSFWKKKGNQMLPHEWNVL